MNRSRRTNHAARIAALAGAVPAVRSRRGVAAIAAMMFLLMFGSLAVAMAISSKGNIRTASTHVHVMRAANAAETGLQVAQNRLREAASRFVISSSAINSTIGDKLWRGATSGMGTVNVLPAPSGFSESSLPTGLAQAIANQHAADQNVCTAAGVAAPAIGNALSNLNSSDYMAQGWVFTPAVVIESANGQAQAAFSIIYAPLANGTDVRAIVTGYDLTYTRNGVPLTRTVMQDLKLTKRVKHAVAGVNKIMLGKNVMIEGNIAGAYTQTKYDYGDPVIMKSDFDGLDPVLDKKLQDFYAALKLYDVDGDNRLRVNHPIEGPGIPSNSKDYDGDGKPDGAFVDITGDGYVDEYDIFLNHFDKNHDGKVVLSAALTAGTPAAGLTPEFVDKTGKPIDDDLALLIDSCVPDRNNNGVWGFQDTNGNGRWDAGEPMNDFDPVALVYRDQKLGYRDGVLDYRDPYAKIRGQMFFKVTQSQWATDKGSDYMTRLHGPVVPPSGKAPQTYGVTDPQEMPSTIPSIFINASTALENLAAGKTFDAQVAANLGVAVTALPAYVESKSAGQGPRYFRIDPDANMDGRPDNYTSSYFETCPYASPSYNDYYYRPVYENMTFVDVQIPVGNNGLFKNCTFIGVTYVRSTFDNTHRLWSEYGKNKLGSDGYPTPVYPRTIYGASVGQTSYPTMLPNTAIPPQAMILMSTQPLDQADIPANQVATTVGYSNLPAPLLVGGKRIVDTKTLSNNIRFHDSLIVGSVVSDNTSVYTQARNKIQFTGATQFTTVNPNDPNNPSANPTAAEMTEISKSSMMLPNFSVDIGTFNSPPTQNVQLQGAIVAGVLDIRGNTSINGALLLTFNPTPGTAPMIDVLGNAIGNPANFNTTLGYFGPADGDAESLDPATLPLVNGVKIVGWDLNGDGIADIPPDQSPTAAQIAAGAKAIPFNGYGHISLRFNPDMLLPDGVMLPLEFVNKSDTYKEGKP